MDVNTFKIHKIFYLNRCSASIHIFWHLALQKTTYIFLCGQKAVIFLVAAHKMRHTLILTGRSSSSLTSET